MNSDDRPTNSPARVLVVEDEGTNRLVIRQMLKQTARGDGTVSSTRTNTIETREAENGQQALEALRADPFDLVLMDVQMPGMDGLEATRAIRRGDTGEANRDVAVIAMTAHSTSEDEEACYEAGVTGYLAKPLRLPKFMETVRKALGET